MRRWCSAWPARSIGGWSCDRWLAIQWPAFKGFTDATGAWLFPFLFITIACGACSGFHSIVASGTTCKQVQNEARRAADRLRLDAAGSDGRGLRAGLRDGAPPGTEAGEARHDLRPRDRQLRAQLNVPMHVRRQLRAARVLQLRVRHARRLHAARPLRAPGDDRAQGLCRRRHRHAHYARGAERVPLEQPARFVP